MTNPEPRRYIEGHVGDPSSGTIIGYHNTQVTTYASSQQQAGDLFDAAEVEACYCQQIVKHYNKFDLPGLSGHQPSLQTILPEQIFVNLNLETIQVGEDDVGRQERIR